MQRDSSLHVHHKNLRKQEPIAIIGMGCRFPGHVTNTDEYWKLMLSGSDVITEVPNSRWNINNYYAASQSAAGKMNTRFGGFLDEFNSFDAAFFNISPKEAAQMDPQQRIFLEVAWQAIENAALKPEMLANTNTGVFVGVCMHDFDRLQAKSQNESKINAYNNLCSASSAIGARLSYFLGLNGPSFAIDTAHSSSMAALYQACLSLRARDCDMALVAGVNLILDPEPSIGYSKANMLSPDGKCKTFDEKANGYVRSEGCGVIVIKPLDTALADNNRILAVIKSTLANQDGASTGLTAPNMLAQKQLLQGALYCADLKPDDIDFFETHGSGTSLGDPTEVDAINQVYASTSRKAPLYLGAIKSQIGHCEAAAGIAGLIKTVLVLQHQHIPANLHFEKANPALKLDKVPCAIPAKAISAKDCTITRAAVSSFGFTGTNTHAILEKAPEPKQSSTKIKLPKEYPFILSAKSHQSLLHLIDVYREYLTQTKERIENICYTAALGRSHFNYRLALSVISIEDLKSQLDNDDLSIHEVKVDEELVSSKSIKVLIKAYIHGKSTSWSEFYAPFSDVLRFVSMPTYCFDDIQHQETNPPKIESPTPMPKDNSLVNLQALIDSWPKDESGRKGAIQDLVASAVASILGINNFQEIEADKKFTQLGLDSLIAVDLRNKLQIELGNELTIPNFYFYEYPTTRILTNYLYEELFGGEQKKATQVQPLNTNSKAKLEEYILYSNRNLTEPLDLSETLHWGLFSKYNLHTISFSVQITTAKEKDYLIESIQQIIINHPALWVYFDKKYPLFKFTGIDASWSPPYVDLSNMTVDEQEQYLYKIYVKTSKQKQLRQFKPPLVSVYVFGLGKGQFEAHFHFSHAIFDEVSTTNFVEELNNKISGKKSNINVLENYINEYTKIIKPAILSAKNSYFARILIKYCVSDTTHSLVLKKRFPNKLNSCKINLTLTNQDTNQLNKLMYRYKITLSQTYFLLFCLSMSRVFNESKFSIFLTTSNRDKSNIYCLGYYARRRTINLEISDSLLSSAQKIADDINIPVSEGDIELTTQNKFIMPKFFYKSKISKFLVGHIKKKMFKNIDRYYSNHFQNFNFFQLLDLVRDSIGNLFSSSEKIKFTYNDVSFFHTVNNDSNQVQFQRKYNLYEHLKSSPVKLVEVIARQDTIHFQINNWPVKDNILMDEFKVVFIEILKSLSEES